MSTRSEVNRWWENYLVRYLVPSIGGIAIVGWLCTNADDAFRSLLFLPPGHEKLDTASLVLVILYGNLFCYIASYPVLVFHATRVIDFDNRSWQPRRWYCYWWSLGLVAFSFLLIWTPWAMVRIGAAFGVVASFSLMQFWRIRVALSCQIGVDDMKDVSSLYGYAYALATRRGISEETSDAPEVGLPDSARTGLVIDQRLWRPELLTTYRHLREHGNAAFMFVLEVALAALVYCVIGGFDHIDGYAITDASMRLGAIGILFACWTTPAVFVHLVGQHLERRFSDFDDRVVVSEKYAQGKGRPPAPETLVTRSSPHPTAHP